MWLVTSVLAALLSAGPSPSAIVGGEGVGGCAWPSVVSLGGVCTGTLVHPQVVVYAAHCGEHFTSVEFGSSAAPRHARTVATAFCEADPQGSQPGAGRDRAYCVLASPMQGVPIVPPLSGCEADALRVGAQVLVVGFGRSEVGEGDKRAVTTTITSVDELELALGGDGRDACDGDSGGPGFVQLDSGQWRAAGIISYGEDPCGDGSVLTRMDHALPFIQAGANLDVAPCFRDGQWFPTSACGGFSAAPDLDAGDWASGCVQPLETRADTCGPAFDADDDATAPRVWFPNADEDAVIEAGARTFAIEAADSDSGVHAIELWVDGVLADTDFSGSNELSATLESGEHLLVAVATDRAGNAAQAEQTLLATASPAMPLDQSRGCGCRQDPAPSPLDILLWGWMFSLAWGSRRSRLVPSGP